MNFYQMFLQSCMVSETFFVRQFANLPYGFFRKALLNIGSHVILAKVDLSHFCHVHPVAPGEQPLVAP